jgi:Na+-transporting methylmalonyl-CoA/oxaloacetate decarboxylase gamma subunit
MSDIGFVAIVVAFFALAIFVVRVLGRMIDRDVDR